MKVQLQPDPICGVCQEPTVSVFGKVEQKKKKKKPWMHIELQNKE